MSVSKVRDKIQWVGHPWPIGYGCWLQTTCLSLLWVRTAQAWLDESDGSSQMLFCARFNVQRGTWGLPPPVKFESCIMIYTVTVLLQCKTQPKANKKSPNTIGFLSNINLLLHYCTRHIASSPLWSLLNVMCNDLFFFKFLTVYGFRINIMK
jgi:hypothetical protein